MSGSASPDSKVYFRTVQTIASFCSFSTWWKILLIIILAANFKNFPLVYHLRILNGIRFVLRSQRSTVKLGPQHTFLPLITSSKATMLETDVFGHKSNSTYFSDVDVARTHFVTTVFSKAIEDFRGSTTMNGLSGKPRSAFTMPLGGVSCTFRKELKPYETYDMWTRILSWDDKWFFLVTHFIKRSDGIEPNEYVLYPQQQRKKVKATLEEQMSKFPPKSCVCATAISKVVFKDGRKTVPPRTMLRLAGLLPNDQFCSTVPKDELLYEIQGACAGSDTDGGYGTPQKSTMLDDTAWCLKLEQGRRRGLKIALEQNSKVELEHEFDFEQALGRHYDGHGFEGVVSTLAQLSGMSSYQLL